MANLHSTLGGLLVAQLALAAFMWRPTGEAEVEARKLVANGADSITKLAVTRSGDDAKPVTLEKRDGHWLITSEGDYPADDTKVAEMVDALAKIELKKPVATQKESFGRLKVADDDFGKKVTYTADGAEHTLHVGAAKSKAIYARLDGGEEVFLAKGPSEFVFKDTARTLWKTNYVEFDKATATTFALTNNGVTLAFHKDGEQWVLDNAPAGVVARSSAVEELVGKAAAVRLGEPAGKEAKPEYGLETGVRVDYAAADGDQTVSGSFRIGVEADNKRYVQAQGNAFVASVPSYAVKNLVEATPESLTESGEAPAAPPSMELPIP